MSSSALSHKFLLFKTNRKIQAISGGSCHTFKYVRGCLFLGARELEHQYYNFIGDFVRLSVFSEYDYSKSTNCKH